MVKWADFLISEVRYHTDKTHIDMVKAHADLGDTVGSAQELTRFTIVANIKKGTSYVTIFKKDNNWHKGQDVRIIEVGSEEFIRTDANEKASDNLENLPEF